MLMSLTLTFINDKNALKKLQKEFWFCQINVCICSNVIFLNILFLYIFNILHLYRIIFCKTQILNLYFYYFKTKSKNNLSTIIIKVISM